MAVDAVEAAVLVDTEEVQLRGQRPRGARRGGDYARVQAGEARHDHAEVFVVWKSRRSPQFNHVYRVTTMIKQKYMPDHTKIYGKGYGKDLWHRPWQRSMAQTMAKIYGKTGLHMGTCGVVLSQ